MWVFVLNFLQKPTVLCLAIFTSWCICCKGRREKKLGKFCKTTNEKKYQMGVSLLPLLPKLNDDFQEEESCAYDSLLLVDEVKFITL